eukprot:15279143-Alexandrium_andersonii.AAC.1
MGQPTQLRPRTMRRWSWDPHRPAGRRRSCDPPPSPRPTAARHRQSKCRSAGTTTGLPRRPTG